MPKISSIYPNSIGNPVTPDIEIKIGKKNEL
jgi:hypothetical protein